MRNLLIILIISVLIVLIASCSPQKRATWHLSRAVHLNSEILDGSRDTINEVNIEYRDTTIYWNGLHTVYLPSDTVRVIDTIYKPGDNPLPDTEMKAVSSDSIAHARYWINAGKRHLETWAVLDTVLVLQDSIKTQHKIIRKSEQIIIKRDAEITEMRTWRESIEDGVVTGLWILGAVVGVVIIIKIWK